MQRAIALLALLLLSALAAAAQVIVRGQFILPQGDFPRESIRFFLQSDDILLNDYRFSDSNGRFILPRLDAEGSYTITVDSDGSTYGDTVYTFRPQFQQVIRVILNPLQPEARNRDATISVASAYRPKPKADRLRKNARKEIERNRFEEAEANLRKAVALDPKFFEAWSDLGGLLLLRQRYDQAETALRQAVEVDPKSYVALLNLGRALNFLHRYAEAIPHLREALRLESRLVAAHLHLGVALLETDQLQEAERELRRTAESKGDEEIAAHLYLGKLYARTAQFEKGIASLETYLRLNPNAPNAREARDLIERMKTASMKKK